MSLPRARREGVLIVGPRPPAIGGIASYIDLVAEHIPVEHVDTPVTQGTFRKVARFIRTCWGIYKARHCCRVLHLHAANGRSFYEKAVFLYLGRLLGYRVIIHIHSGRFDTFALRERGRWIRRIALSSSDAVIALGQYWKNVIETVAPSANVIVVHNAVKVPDLPADRKSGNIVLFLGAVKEEKGVSDLLHAFARVKLQVPDAILRLGGPVEPAEHRKYDRLVKKFDLTRNVEFCGPVNKEQIPQILSQADVFVLPSYAEGLPMALLEAMGFGIPVVATNVGAIPEVVTEGKSGFIVRPGDIDALANRIISLLMDVKMRRRMGADARATVERRYNIQRTAKELRSVYRRLGAIV